MPVSYLKYLVQTGVTISKASLCLLVTSNISSRQVWLWPKLDNACYLKHTVQTGVTEQSITMPVTSNIQSRQVWLWAKLDNACYLKTHSPDRCDCDWAKHHNACYFKHTVQTGVTEQSITMLVTTNTQSRQVWLSAMLDNVCFLKHAIHTAVTKI